MLTKACITPGVACTVPAFHGAKQMPTMFTVIRTRNSAGKLREQFISLPKVSAAARAEAIEIFRVPRGAGAGARETATPEVGRPAETRRPGSDRNGMTEMAPRTARGVQSQGFGVFKQEQATGSRYNLRARPGGPSVHRAGQARPVPPKPTPGGSGRTRLWAARPSIAAILRRAMSAWAASATAP